LAHRISRPVLAAVAAALAVAVAACANDEPVQPVDPPPATLAQLTGPWRAAPLRLDSATWARVEDACRVDIQMAPATRAQIIDARGAGVVTVAMTGQQFGRCDALQVMATGEVVGAGSGMRSDGPQQPIVEPGTGIGPIEQGTIDGGGLTVTGWSVYGPVGAGINTVVVQVPGQPQVFATVMNGQFSAWWPVRQNAANGPNVQPGLAPLLPPSLVVLGYDATGALVNQVRH
jgi:hypothetical protein